jgi:ATP-dependent Clp protease ATP-binding subunit ClpA
LTLANIIYYNLAKQIIVSTCCSLNHDYIGSEHLLLALMKTDSVATKALEAAGANYDLLRQVVINNIGKGCNHGLESSFHALLVGLIYLIC